MVLIIGKIMQCTVHSEVTWHAIIKSYPLQHFASKTTIKMLYHPASTALSEILLPCLAYTYRYWYGLSESERVTHAVNST